MIKLIRNKSVLCMAAVLAMVVGSMTVCAGSNSFEGTMYFRVLDGSSNDKFYSFNSGKTLTMSGSILGIDTTNYDGTANPTYVTCIEGRAGGKGTVICEASATAKYDGNPVSFSATGTTKKTSSKYYMYCYKIEDDGIDVSISSTLSD